MSEIKRLYVLIRLCDVMFAMLGLALGAPFLLVLFVAGFFDTGSPLFWQERVGRWGRPFLLVKFRTMKKGTASVATHLAEASNITPLGRFLRKTKLDELPQLWNVLLGDMSLVGPRPCLPSQEELVRYRQELSVFNVRPGITGLAQVKGIDMSTPKLLAETDALMIRKLSFREYVRYIVQTLSGQGRGDRVKNS